jgi:hypothetical protein
MSRGSWQEAKAEELEDEGRNMPVIAEKYTIVIINCYNIKVPAESRKPSMEGQ